MQVKYIKIHYTYTLSVLCKKKELPSHFGIDRKSATNAITTGQIAMDESLYTGRY